MQREFRYRTIAILSIAAIVAASAITVSGQYSLTVNKERLEKTKVKMNRYGSVDIEVQHAGSPERRLLSEMDLESSGSLVIPKAALRKLLAHPGLSAAKQEEE